MADDESSAQPAIPRDLGPAPQAAFDWADGQRLRSLETLHETVSKKIDITAGWYMRGKGGTLVRLTHSGLPDAEECASHRQGWTHYLERLAMAAAGGDPGPDLHLKSS